MADDERGPLPMAKRRAGGRQMTKDDFDAEDDAPVSRWHDPPPRQLHSESQ